MKALTVQNPWAWAIIHGTKRVENRTTMWGYRGPLAIHAGTRWSDRGGRSGLVWDDLRDTYGWPTGPVSLRDDPRPQFDVVRPIGAIIGTVDLIDVHRAEGDPHGVTCCDSPWAEIEYVQADGEKRKYITHLVLENPVALAEPIYCKGRLGLWDTDRETTERLAG